MLVFVKDRRHTCLVLKEGMARIGSYETEDIYKLDGIGMAWSCEPSWVEVAFETQNPASPAMNDNPYVGL